MAAIFFSYCHVDEDFKDRLEVHLSALKREGLISTWHDRRIVAGQDFDKRISEHLDQDDVILLLVSADFIASEYCWEVEMARAMERHEAGEAVVIPVILRPCDWKQAPFGKLVAAPIDGKPISQWSDIDEGYLQVARTIRVAVESPQRLTPFAALQPKAPAPLGSNIRSSKSRASHTAMGSTIEQSNRILESVFAVRMRELKVSARIKNSIRAVAGHKEYPHWMSISGELVKNPVWEGDSVSKIYTDYHPAGSTPPKIMHLDVLLMRRNDDHGHGQLYTYYSVDWDAYLLNFRQRVPEEKRSQRNFLNAEKIARHWKIPVESVEVNPLQDKYAVSVKRHPKYQDLIFYVFEFCSVVLNNSSTSAINLLSADPAPSRKWLGLSELRNDKASWSVNGDVIRALHELFTYDLGPLPVFLRP